MCATDAESANKGMDEADDPTAPSSSALPGSKFQGAWSSRPQPPHSRHYNL
jgi:hypothetical protein